MRPREHRTMHSPGRLQPSQRREEKPFRSLRHPRPPDFFRKAPCWAVLSPWRRSALVGTPGIAGGQVFAASRQPQIDPELPRAARNAP